MAESVAVLSRVAVIMGAVQLAHKQESVRRAASQATSLNAVALIPSSLHIKQTNKWTYVSGKHANNGAERVLQQP